MTCPACGADLAGAPALRGVDRLLGTPGTFAVHVCSRCGSGATYPPAGTADLAAFYPETYGPHARALTGLLGLIASAGRAWVGYRALKRPPLATLRGMPSGRLVDVGCGRGDLAAQFVRRGWQATGVEPSPAAAAIAAARGIDARVGTLADVALDPGTYDAVVFQHSLEHTADPLGDLMRIRAALRSGGRVLITVPNFACWQRRRFGDRWFHLDVPRHRTHFTPTGLRALLERAGLAVEHLSTSTSSIGLPATVQYAVAGRCLFPSGLGLHVAASLCVLSVPLAWLMNHVAGGGDLLHAIARLSTAP